MYFNTQQEIHIVNHSSFSNSFLTLSLLHLTYPCHHLPTSPTRVITSPPHLPVSSPPHLTYPCHHLSTSPTRVITSPPHLPVSSPPHLTYPCHHLPTSHTRVITSRHVCPTPSCRCNITISFSSCVILIQKDPTVAVDFQH